MPVIGPDTVYHSCEDCGKVLPWKLGHSCDSKVREEYQARRYKHYLEDTPAGEIVIYTATLDSLMSDDDVTQGPLYAGLSLREAAAACIANFQEINKGRVIDAEYYTLQGWYKGASKRIDPARYARRPTPKSILRFKLLEEIPHILPTHAET